MKKSAEEELSRLRQKKGEIGEERKEIQRKLDELGEEAHILQQANERLAWQEVDVDGHIATLEEKLGLSAQPVKEEEEAEDEFGVAHGMFSSLEEYVQAWKEERYVTCWYTGTSCLSCDKTGVKFTWHRSSPKQRLVCGRCHSWVLQQGHGEDYDPSTWEEEPPEEPPEDVGLEEQAARAERAVEIWKKAYERAAYERDLKLAQAYERAAYEAAEDLKTLERNGRSPEDFEEDMNEDFEEDTPGVDEDCEAGASDMIWRPPLGMRKDEEEGWFARKWHEQNV